MSEIEWWVLFFGLLLMGETLIFFSLIGKDVDRLVSVLLTFTGCYFVAVFMGYARNIGRVDFVSAEKEVKYTVTDKPHASCAKTVNIDGWKNKIFLLSLEPSNIRGGCASIPSEGVPFKLVEGSGPNDLVVIPLNKESAAAAKEKKK